jgi:hypothetical protein
MDWYGTNPVLNSLIQILAREGSNVRIRVKNKITGDIEEEGKTDKEIPKKVYSLFNKPNPLQRRWTFFGQRRIFKEATGNVFSYANAPLGMKPNILTVKSLWNIWTPQMEFELAKNFFEATEISEIVKLWKFVYGSTTKVFKPEEILFSAEPNTDIKDGWIFGRPKAAALIKPLTNIDMAYEARNVILKNRGMDLVFTPRKGDESGLVPLQPEEVAEVQESWEKYGLLEGQRQAYFSKQPMDVTQITRDVRKLGLFDEISSDAIICAHLFGVPDILMKLDLNGTTYENQEASLRQLYQGTLIPYSDQEFIEYNEFLGMNETDWVIEGTWDHIPCLQESETEKYEAYKTISDYMLNLFKVGAVTLNTILEEMDMAPIDGGDGDKRIWDFSPEQIAIILSKVQNQNENTEGQNQNSNGKKKEFSLNGHG